MISSIPRQLGLLLFVISLVFGIGLYAVGDYVLLDNFRLLERRLLALDMERINNLFAERQHALEDKAIDNGGWDGTYRFVKTQNQNYIDEIFSPQNFAIVKADIIGLLTLDGTLIYGRMLKSGQVVPLELAYQKAFKENISFLTPPTKLSGKGGLLAIGDKNYQIGTGRIQKSSGEDPEILGIFLIGREVNASFLEGFQTDVKINFAFSQLSPSTFSHSPKIFTALEDDQDFNIALIDSNTIKVHFLVSDLTGKPRFIITLTKHYDFLSQAKESLYLFMAWFGLLCLILFVGLMIFFKQKIFNRLARVKSIPQFFYQQKSTTLPIGKKDEIGHLLMSVNALLEMNHILVEQGFQMAVLVDQGGKIINANRRIHQLLSWSYPSLIGMDVTLLFDWMPAPDSKEAQARIIEIKLRTYYDDCLPAELYRTTLHVDEKELTLYLLNDLSDRKRVESRFLKNNYYDAQTMLPNRHLFLVRLEQCLQRSQQDPSLNFSVALIDIDRFRMLCENITTQSADYALNEILIRIQSVIDEYDGLGKLNRMTGDEFALIIPGNLMYEKLVHLATRIRKVVAIPVVVDGKNIFVNVCMGILVGAQRFLEVGDILTRLNFVLEEAKQKGINGFSLYENDADKALRGQRDMLTIEQEIREALNNEEIFAFFQPIMDLESNELVGFEALMRWISPQNNDYMPIEFVTLAEEAGLITAVDRKIVRQALEALGAWNLLLPDLYISVNISIRDLIEPGFIEFIADTLSELKINPANLVLEITENFLVLEVDIINAALDQLEACGIKIALDDFGRRYSSLHYINRLPISYLKVGHAFTTRIETDEVDARVIEAIIGLSESLGMDFVAEGIESTTQLEWLRRKGCCYGQGFYFSAALPRMEANQFIQEHIRRKRA